MSFLHLIQLLIFKGKSLQQFTNILLKLPYVGLLSAIIYQKSINNCVLCIQFSFELPNKLLSHNLIKIGFELLHASEELSGPRVVVVVSGHAWIHFAVFPHKSPQLPPLCKRQSLNAFKRLSFVLWLLTCGDEQILLEGFVKFWNMIHKWSE